MNYAYVIFILVAGWIGREIYINYQKNNLETQLAKARRALGKEKVKHAVAKSKRSGKKYHDMRDAYGRFAKRGRTDGNA